MKNFLSLFAFLILISCSNNNSEVAISTSVTDIDGNVYQTVKICNQTWTKTNLNVSKYRNGDVIHQVTDPAAWSNLTTGAWCYYNNNTANGTIYGKLYNFYAVNDPRGLAPVGYHIPSETEWTSLNDCLGIDDLVIFNKMIEIGTSHWIIQHPNANNSSGFTALPGGFREGSNGNDYYLGESAQFSSSSLFYYQGTLEPNKIWIYTLGGGISDSMYKTSGGFKQGLSVRCLKD